VVGAGAVGGYFGGRMAEAGEPVCFLARGRTLDALRRQGLRVESPQGDFRIAAVEATDDPGEVGIVDLVILGVKAWQVREAAESILPMVGPATTVLPLQNGVEAAEELSAVLGPEPVLGGLCRIVAYQVEPGHIRHESLSPTLAFGELDGGPSSRVEALRDAFRKAAGVAVETPADIRSALWKKFLFIAPFGGVGAVTRSPAGAIRRVPEVRRMLESAMREVLALSRACGASLRDDAVAAALRFLDGMPAEATASMQRDITEGRPSELGHQTGAIVRLSRQAGLDAPVNAFLYHSLLPLEMRARGELQFP
jgi:2-dehydropantoate 2-reductase